MVTRSKNTEPVEKVEWSDWQGAPEEAGRTYHHWLLKVLAWVVFAVSVFYFARGTVLLGVISTGDANDYSGSAALSSTMTQTVRSAISLYFFYIDEDATESGESPAGRVRATQLLELETHYLAEREALTQEQARLEYEKAALQSAESDNSDTAKKAIDELGTQLEDVAVQIATMDGTYSASKEAIINADREAFDALELELDSSNGVYIAYVDSNGDVNSNFNVAPDVLPEFFASLPQAAYYGAGYYGSAPENAVSLTDSSMYRDMPVGGTFYVGYSDERYEALRMEYEANRDAAAAGPSYLFWGGVLALASLVWLAFTAGASANRDGVTTFWVDRIYVELLFVIVALLISLIIKLSSMLSFLSATATTDFAMGTVNAVTLLTMYLPIAVGSALVCVFVQSCSRRLKLHVFFGTSVIGKLAHLVYSLIKYAFTGAYAGNLPKRSVFKTASIAAGECLVVIFGCAMTLLIGALGFFVGFMAFALYNLMINNIMLRRARELARIVDDVKRIGTGELTHRVAPAITSEYAMLVDGINDIAKGLETSLKEQLKAERMRTELITNVSHDLRTPLTGIITYVDLLKNGGACSDSGAEYLDVLEKKCLRLKTLTDDLFEAAKAASGSLPVEHCRIDLQELLEQGLGELEDTIEQSGLSLHTSFPEKRVYAAADGKRLWRAVNNLITNALKYSLPGSRVYITVSENTEKKRAAIEIKNISRDPIERDVNTLTERFARGDSARHTEGSGLGLSISGSLTRLMGGELTLSADGDLFKTLTELPLYDEGDRDGDEGCEKTE